MSYFTELWLKSKDVVVEISLMQLHASLLCRAFLWEGDVNLSKAPPVSRDWVHKHKNGTRNCQLWDLAIASQGKYIWQVALKSYMLWVVKLVEHLYKEC